MVLLVYLGVMQYPQGTWFSPMHYNQQRKLGTGQDGNSAFKLIFSILELNLKIGDRMFSSCEDEIQVYYST